MFPFSLFLLQKGVLILDMSCYYLRRSFDFFFAGKSLEASALFAKMQEESIKPGKVIFFILLTHVNLAKILSTCHF